ncbi:MAG: aspartate/glutamate racemase family protein [bacterium]
MSKPIIVFDSGIGGMSIYRPLRLALPKENIVYLADSINFPYGNKSSLWLSHRFQTLANDFLALDPQIVVIACNSATTNVIKELRRTLDCPVIGVEPVIKPLAQYQAALALMTQTTAIAAPTAALLKRYGQHVQIFSPPDLASAIEYNDIDRVKRIIFTIKKIVQENHIEVVGLSCTHYSLITSTLQKALPNIIIIDPSAAVVKEVLRVLSSL